MIFGFLVIFLLIIAAVILNISLVYPLFIGLIILSFITHRMGYSIKDIASMIFKGGKKSLTIIRIFVLIGAVTAVWMACGTVEVIVFYGIKLINPNLFVLYAFLITSITSFLLGTSFGTVGTIGIALMVLAKGGGVNVNVAGGAIIAGAYFGDRCSPMSSMANLVSEITDTNIYENFKNMFKNTMIPYIISLVIYFFISSAYKMNISGNILEQELINNFHLGFITILPALLIFVFVFLKIDVKKAMLGSIIVGMIIAVIVQKTPFISLLKYIIFGFSMDSASELSKVMKGGGIMSMLKIAGIVLLSFSYSVIFEETNMLKKIEGVVDKLSLKLGVFTTTLIIAIITATASFTQALCVILTNQLVKKLYIKEDKYQLSLALSNTSVMVSGLIPWNIASLVPASMLSLGAGFIPFAVYMYLVPILNLLMNKASPKNN